MKRWLMIGAAVLVPLVVAVVTIGFLLPVRHTASGSATFAASADSVFALVADVASYPAWRSGVARVELLSAPGATPVRFREHSGGDAIAFEIAAFEPPRRMVSVIADSTLPFGGRWTFEVTPAPAGAGTTLTITEDGEVYNPVFRFVSRFVIGHASGIEQYLRDVGARIAGPPG